ncbi:MAG: GntR family transcriptional regulator [Sphaerochaeta sp.]
MSDTLRSQLIEHIYESLREQIRSGELPGGTKLSENTLAYTFSCSRTPVREAFKRLDQDGFVVTIAHSGTYVKDLTMQEYQQLTEVRAYLEALAMRSACEQHADTTPLIQILDEMDRLIASPLPFDVQTFSSLHYQFHLDLINLAGNELLTRTYSRLNLGEAALLFSQTLNKRGLKKTQEEHRRLVRAIDAGDIKEGERFMLAHLWRKRNQFKRQDQEG